MIEHEGTLTVIRNDYTNKVKEYLARCQYKGNYLDDYDYFDLVDRCTILQLRSLYRSFIKPGSVFSLNRCNPQDHLSLMLGSMYIGIEPDGYTHT